MSANLLLMGSPGSGKTTVVQRLLERLEDLRLAGFFTRELRELGQRVGFEVVGLSGRQAVLAHVRSDSSQRVGRYGVEAERLRPLVEVELGKPATEVDAFVIDEIGRMELFCPPFVEAVPRLLDGPVPVLATVALQGEGLIAEVKTRPDVSLIEVSPDNRESLAAELEGWLRERLRTR
jgi:nucleoside-triphosphatase